MTAMERVLKALNHEEPDRVPVYPIISGASRRLINVSYKDWVNDADLCAKALLKAREEFDLDCIVTLIDLSVECDAWGQELIYPENEAAHPNYDNCVIQDIEDYAKIKKVDLVTGFLGVGKTTFIKKLLRHYRSQSLRAVVIENEFGKAGIDTAILREEQFDVTSLAGGCICCGLKVNFHDLLLELSEHYDRIIVEPSGIYTLEDFYDIMESPSITGKR